MIYICLLLLFCSLHAIDTDYVYCLARFIKYCLLSYVFCFSVLSLFCYWLRWLQIWKIARVDDYSWSLIKIAGVLILRPPMPLRGTFGISTRRKRKSKSERGSPDTELLRLTKCERASPDAHLHYFACRRGIFVGSFCVLPFSLLYLRRKRADTLPIVFAKGEKRRWTRAGPTCENAGLVSSLDAGTCEILSQAPSFLIWRSRRFALRERPKIESACRRRIFLNLTNGKRLAICEKGICLTLAIGVCERYVVQYWECFKHSDTRSFALRVLVNSKSACRRRNFLKGGILT